GAHLRSRFGPPEHGEPGDRQAVREPRGAAGRPVGLRHPGARLGAGPVRVPARGHRAVRRQAPRRDPAQRRPAARLHAGARDDRVRDPGLTRGSATVRRASAETTVISSGDMAAATMSFGLVWTVPQLLTRLPGGGPPRSSRIVVSGIDAKRPGWVISCRWGT